MHVCTHCDHSASQDTLLNVRDLVQETLDIRFLRPSFVTESHFLRQFVGESHFLHEFAQAALERIFHAFLSKG